MFLFLLSAFNCNVINVRRIFIIFLSWVCVIEQFSKNMFCALAKFDSSFIQFFPETHHFRDIWLINFGAKNVNRKMTNQFSLEFCRINESIKSCQSLSRVSVAHSFERNTKYQNIHMNKEKEEKTWRIFYWALQKPSANIYSSKNAVERIKVKQCYRLKST